MGERVLINNGFKKLSFRYAGICAIALNRGGKGKRDKDENKGNKETAMIKSIKRIHRKAKEDRHWQIPIHWVRIKNSTPTNSEPIQRGSSLRLSYSAEVSLFLRAVVSLAIGFRIVVAPSCRKCSDCEPVRVSPRC
jgi:hypothetical protein